jgi:hypothetical protein
VPKNQNELTDIETGLDNDSLSQVRFGRSRFLRILGAALFGAATIGLTESTAFARPASDPPGCGAFTKCANCSGGKPGSGHHATPGTCREGATGKPKNKNCWYTSSPRTDGGTDRWKCCDYVRHGNHCYCRTYVGKI